MRTFPEFKFNGDVEGSGTSVELIADMRERKTSNRFVEIMITEDEDGGGYRKGSFGQYQNDSCGEVRMSIRFMSDGENGGMDTDCGFTTPELRTPLRWVIHPDEG